MPVPPRPGVPQSSKFLSRGARPGVPQTLEDTMELGRNFTILSGEIWRRSALKCPESTETVALGALVGSNAGGG